MKKLVLTLVVAAFAVASSLQMTAADAPAVDKKEAVAKPIPFGGKITALDKQAKTVTLGKRVFHVTSETKIMKNEKPATLDDATVGEEVGGAYKQDAEKKMHLVSLRIGPKPEAPKK
jgi:hypothetical protein